MLDYDCLGTRQHKKGVNFLQTIVLAHNNQVSMSPPPFCFFAHELFNTHLPIKLSMYRQMVTGVWLNVLPATQCH